MGNFIGVWKLDEPIYCQKEISGKRFRTVITGIPVVIAFPSLPDAYDGESKALSSGDLISPFPPFQSQVNWGMINAWPDGLFTVNALVVAAFCEKELMSQIYADFPRWKEKVSKLRLIDSGNYIQAEQKIPAMLTKGNGIYDGVEFFEYIEGAPLERIKNHRTTDHIRLHFLERDECYTAKRMNTLFANAGSAKEIDLPYELLIVAYRAFARLDFRSAVIVAGSGLEMAIESRIKLEYIHAAEGVYEREAKKHRMLGGKFRWLSELNIPIPVSDYDTAILDVRNDTTHEGLCPTEAQARTYLEKCKILIEKYSPSVLAQ